MGARSQKEEARLVLAAHKAGLDARRSRDLISEKLFLHIDGSGDFQYADIWYDTRIEIPRDVSGFRKTENLLRLVVDNAVAQHTTTPLRYFASSPPDRQARDKALVDTVWANYVAEQQDLNGLSAEALYLSMASGFCPLHRYWRDDPFDQYEAVPGAPGGLVPGLLDCWVGNPFGTVFNRGALRHSCLWASYDRVLPADMVRKHFDHMLQGRRLEGTTKIPSASLFQTIAQQWKTDGLGIHGSPVMTTRRGESGESDEELIVVVCRETAPGVLTDWPQGRLQLIAVPGAVDLRLRAGQTSEAVLLADQPLPAGDFSFTNIYSHHRGNDIHGKPWVEDIDADQVELNLTISKRDEFADKMMRAPIIAPAGAIGDDMMNIDGYDILEMDPSIGGSFRPRVMEWPQQVLQVFDKKADEKRRAIYTGGGYQAVSRGESPGSRMAYRAILALQHADNTIHGPVNVRFRRAMCDFARGCWRQMKAFGSVPWLVTITGDEYAYLAEPYIDNLRLSDHPPAYKLVNAFGASPELQAQELLELVPQRGADGEPLLRTEEFRRAYPNAMVFDNDGDPTVVQRRRAKTIASQIIHQTRKFREATGFTETTRTSPMVIQAGQRIFLILEGQYPRLQDDDLAAHLSTLSEITQDETVDPVARIAAQFRQAKYYEWQAMMQPQSGGTLMSGAPATEPTRPSTNPRAIAAERLSGGERPAA